MRSNKDRDEQGIKTADDQSPFKRKNSSVSRKELTVAAKTSQGTIDRQSIQTPFRQAPGIRPTNRATQNLNLKQGLGEEEDDILLNTSDEYNQGHFEFQENKQQSQQVKGLFTRQKNEKSLSLHDPNIDGEFLKKISEQNSHNFSPGNRHKKLNKLQSQMLNQNLINHIGNSQLRQSKQSYKRHRDLSIHSLNQYNSNIGQNDSASKQSKIPSQKMQDYETKPLKRYSSLNLKIHSRNSDCNRLMWKNKNEFDQRYAQQFDSDNALKRKKNFSIYNISNKLFESNVLLQDLSKKDRYTAGNMAQNKVNMTPSKKQIDDICPQIDGAKRESIPRGNSVHTRTSNLLSQKHTDNQIINSQSNLFESPGNRQKNGSKMVQTNSLTGGNQTSMNQSVPSNQLNPLESPDPVGSQIQQKKMMIRTQFRTDSYDQPLKLRNNRINEVINENSEFESQQNHAQDKEVSPSDLGFINQYQQQPMSARTPAIHAREYPYLYRSNSITKIVDLQRKSFDIINRHQFHSFFGKNNESEEIQKLQKQLRDQNAEFVKQKAVLEQQVQLLTQQLSIESERVKNLKKNYTAALQAFKQKKNNSSDSISPRQQRTKNNNLSQSPTSMLRHSQSSFSRQNAHQDLTKSYSNMNRNSSLILQNYQYKPDPWSAKKIEILQKDNKDMLLTIKRYEELIQTTKEQSRNQEDLMYAKEQEIVQLRANIIEYENKLKSNAESRIQTVVKLENKQTQELERQIKNMKADQDRKINKGVEEYQARNLLLNDQIIDYQTQIKNLNNEINTHMTRLNMKEQSFRALEQQVHIYENQIQNLNRDHTKVIDEYENKIQNLERELQKLQNVLRQLRTQCEKDNNQMRKIPKKFTALINSSIDNVFCHSNIVTDNAQPEETIKFVSSANNSTNQFETSIQQDPESNLNGPRQILTTDVMGNQSAIQQIPVDRIFSELSKSHLEIQTCIAQVYITSKEKKQQLQQQSSKNAIRDTKFESIHENQIDREIDVLRDDNDQSIELKDRNGIGISPIVHGAKKSRAYNNKQKHEILTRTKKEEDEAQKKRQNDRSDEQQNVSASQIECTSPSLDQKPLKLSNYWANDEQFKDDGTCSLENVNGLRRMIANMRSRKNKLVVKFNNMKSDSIKENKRLENQVNLLKDQIKLEKDKRVDVQLQKIEQSSALYETINEKATKINKLKQQVHELESEKDESRSMGRSYLGAGTRLSVDQDDSRLDLKKMYRTGNQEIEPSVYQSQQLYNLKGLQKGTKKHSNRSMSAKRNSKVAGGNLSLKSMNQIKMDGFRKYMMDNNNNDQGGAQTQRQASVESNKKRRLSRYMTDRPCLEMNVPEKSQHIVKIMSPPHANSSNKIGKQMLKNISSLQAASLQDQMILQQHDLLSDKESSQNMASKRSPRDTKMDQVRGIQKSPKSFIQHSHLQQNKTLTLKQLDSQQSSSHLKNKKLKQSASNIHGNNQKSLISNLNKASIQHIQAITKGNVILENNQVMCGCAPKNILACKPSNKNNYDQYETDVMHDKAPQQNNYMSQQKLQEEGLPSERDRNQMISPSHTRDYETTSNNNQQIQERAEYTETITGMEDNGYDSQVNIMSPSAHFKKRSADLGLKQSIKNLQYGYGPVEDQYDQASNDSEKELDIGQENQGSCDQNQPMSQNNQVKGSLQKKEGIPPLNLQLMSQPSSTTYNAQQSKGLYYGDMGKQKIQKAQSPVSNNYSRFLTQNTEGKNNNNQLVLKPQIIQRPKIQNYLTQNLPNKNLSGERKEKNQQDIFMKKTLSQKNLAARSSYHVTGNNQNQKNADDKMVYTMRAGSKKFGSPRNTVDNNSMSNQPSLSSRFEQDPHQYYNKASSYLSSQKMTPNMQSLDQSSNSHRGLTGSGQKFSNTHQASSRAMNSFFSQPSQIGFIVGNSINPSYDKSNPGGNTGNQMEEESLYHQQSSDMKRRIVTSGRQSKQSNASVDSNASQTVKQQSKYQGGASRQSTTQQMYQTYKNKYLNKK